MSLMKSYYESKWGNEQLNEIILIMNEIVNEPTKNEWSECRKREEMNGIELMKLMKWNSLAASLSLMNGTGHQRAEARRQAHQPLQQSKRK